MAQNLILYSDQFEVNPPWQRRLVSVVADPGGYEVVSESSGTARLYQTVTEDYSSDVTLWFRVEARAGTATQMTLSDQWGKVSTTFDLTATWAWYEVSFVYNGYRSSVEVNIAPGTPSDSVGNIQLRKAQVSETQQTEYVATTDTVIYDSGSGSEEYSGSVSVAAVASAAAGGGKTASGGGDQTSATASATFLGTKRARGGGSASAAAGVSVAAFRTALAAVATAAAAGTTVVGRAVRRSAAGVVGAAAGAAAVGKAIRRGAVAVTAAAVAAAFGINADNKVRAPVERRTSVFVEKRLTALLSEVRATAVLGETRTVSVGVDMKTTLDYFPDKYTGEDKDYEVDWSSALQEGETVTSFDFTVSGGGLTAYNLSLDGAVAQVWLSGGTPRRSYLIGNTVQTSAGRTLYAEVGIRVV